jgi:DNA-binding transcriptional MerR regulator
MKPRAATRQLKYPMSITEAALAVGVSTSSLRFYERKGIVAPIRFGANDVRVFLPEHVDAVRAYRAKYGKFRK